MTELYVAQYSDTFQTIFSKNLSKALQEFQNLYLHTTYVICLDFLMNIKQ